MGEQFTRERTAYHNSGGALSETDFDESGSYSIGHYRVSEDVTRVRMNAAGNIIVGTTRNAVVIWNIIKPGENQIYTGYSLYANGVIAFVKDDTFVMVSGGRYEYRYSYGYGYGYSDITVCKYLYDRCRVELKLNKTLDNNRKYDMVAISKDGKEIATVDNAIDASSYTSAIFDIETGDLIHTIQFDNYVTSIAFDESKQLWVALIDGTLQKFATFSTWQENENVIKQAVTETDDPPSTAVVGTRQNLFAQTPPVATEKPDSQLSKKRCAAM